MLCDWKVKESWICFCITINLGFTFHKLGNEAFGEWGLWGDILYCFVSAKFNDNWMVCKVKPVYIHCIVYIYTAVKVNISIMDCDLNSPSQFCIQYLFHKVLYNIYHKIVQVLKSVYNLSQIWATNSTNWHIIIDIYVYIYSLTIEVDCYVLQFIIKIKPWPTWSSRQLSYNSVRVNKKVKISRG